MTRPTCLRPGCDRPSPDGAPLCTHCARTLEVALVNIAAYAGELDTVRARLTRYGERNGSRGSTPPLPYDPRATDDEWTVRNTLVGWVRLVMDERGEHVGMPADTLPAMAYWLTGHVEWLRHHDAGPECLDEVTAAEGVLRRLIDAPAERWYAGPCSEPMDEDGTECGRDLYAKPGATVVYCPACDTEHDVDGRRKWLLAAAEDHLATATELARAVTTLGMPVTPERVWKWAERGRIVAKAHGERDRPLYRVGDVLDLLAPEAQEPRRMAG